MECPSRGPASLSPGHCFSLAQPRALPRLVAPDLLSSSNQVFWSSKICWDDHVSRDPLNYSPLTLMGHTQETSGPSYLQYHFLHVNDICTQGFRNLKDKLRRIRRNPHMYARPKRGCHVAKSSTNREAGGHRLEV